MGTLTTGKVLFYIGLGLLVTFPTWAAMIYAWLMEPGNRRLEAETNAMRKEIDEILERCHSKKSELNSL